MFEIIEISLKKTPLAQVHKKLGAKMVEFSGWYMPVYYSSIIDEHTTTRTKAGLFDICHMGEFIIKGLDSIKFLQKLLTNNLNKLYPGKAIYSPMCYENGTTVDDLFVYQLKDDEFMMVVNAANVEKDFSWIKTHSANFNVEVINISEQTGKIDLQGPLSEKILRKLTNIDFPPRFFIIKTYIADIKTLLSRTGYTGEDGFELYFPLEETEKMWNKLLEAGKDEGLKPVGLGARDTLRIEACYPLYWHEVSDKITPIEAGLGWAVKTDKEDFIGKSVLEKQKKQGTGKILVAFGMIDRGIPREHYEVFANHENSPNEFSGCQKGENRLFVHYENIGHVTSGTFSPTFKKPLGMALIKKAFFSEGNRIKIKIRDKFYNAVIVKKPFYKYKGGK